MRKNKIFLAGKENKTLLEVKEYKIFLSGKKNKTLLTVNENISSRKEKSNTSGSK